MKGTNNQYRLKIVALVAILCSFCITSLQAKHNDKPGDTNMVWTIGEITWSGQNQFQESELSDLLGINEGQVYSRNKIENSTKYTAGTESQLQHLFMDKGYLFAKVNIEEFYIGNEINLDLNVDLGPQVTIKNIYIQGTAPLKKKQILNQISSKEGSLLSREHLLNDQDLLYSEGIVVSSLEIDANIKTGKAVLIFKLKERKHYPELLAGN